MKIAIRSYGDDTINGFGGGEHRWVANLGWFLEREGHIIHRYRQQEGCPAGYDIYFDAAWEDCHRIHPSVPHVHFSFFAQNNGAMNFPCLPSGKCVMAVPYRNEWQKNLVWAKTIPYKFKNVMVPQPYPDALLPGHSSVPGFQRREIFWGSKDCFHPHYVQNNKRPDGREYVVVQGGLDTLKALIRLQKKAEFKMNFILAHHTLGNAPPSLGVGELLNQIREKEFWDIVPWTHVVDTLSRCKLNVPVGGLWGSIPESIFTRGQPMIYSRNLFSDRFGSILPHPEDCDENDIYDALETLWFDERIYKRNYDLQQELFKEHRTDGIRQNLSLLFEQLEVRA